MYRITHHYDIVQGTDEWKEIRAGRAGGTSAGLFLVNGKTKSGLGKGVLSLVYEKAAEFVTGKREAFTTFAMQRGTDLEPLARSRYAEQEFVTVKEVGYISYGDYLGYSPDGLVGDDGLIEIKCPLGPEFVRFVHTSGIKSEHFAQMQWGLWITGREWCDYVMYHPEFDPKDLIVKRVYPDSEAHERFEKATQAYVGRLEQVLNLIAAQKQDA